MVGTQVAGAEQQPFRDAGHQMSETMGSRTERMQAAWRRANDALGPATRLIIPLAGLAVLNGLAEAGVLALIAQAAFAMSTGADSASLNIGPLGLDGAIPTLLGIAFALAMVRVVAQWALAFLTARMSSQTQARLQRRLFTSYSAADWSTQSLEREGHLQELITAHARRAMQAAMIAAGVLPPLLAFAILVGSAFAISPVIALAVAVTAITLFLLLRPFGRRTRRQSQKQSSASLSLAESVGEAVRLSEDTQVYGTAEQQLVQIDERIEGLRRPFFRSQLLTMGVPALYQGIALALVIVGLAVLYGVGAENLGSLGAIVLMLVRALAYGQQLQSAYQKLNDVTPFLDRMSAQIERYQASLPPAGTEPMPRLERLSFDRVAFRYNAEEAVLDDVSFTVHVGETIGIVGPSGAGKSTLVQILLRLRQPDGGAFLVNGRDATVIERSQWQRRVAFVSQESRLLAGTVAENIRYHRPWITDEDIVVAAGQAQIHDEIMTWSGGYDHRIGQRLDAVSGGQRQRICLARALAGKPELLVLDEPTSALDPHSESAIQASLELMRGQLTLFIIAHRMTTLRACDRIMVLVKGHLEGFDTPDSLRASGGYYRRTMELAGLGSSGD